MSGAAAGQAPWAVDALLDDPGSQILLCCGAGGVGKTTTAAALALRAAERGRRVVVLTVDPARRLAQALGVDGAAGAATGSSATGHPVPGVDASAGGSLDALVLDAAGTLDALVDAALAPERAAAVKQNPVYASLASSFSGTQEYMAMERLGQLREMAAGGRAPWDLIVVDTPPSRSALDFLDAPERLAGFLDGRFARLLLAPSRLGRRGGRGGLVGAVTSGVTGGLAAVMDKVLGARLLRDVEALVAALDTVFGGFRARAATTTAALVDAGTSFVVITAPEPDPVSEAVFFLRRLREQSVAPAALVVNRAVRPAGAGTSSALDAGDARAAALVADSSPSGSAAAAVLRLHADLAARGAQEQELVARALADAGEDGLPVALVPAQPGEVTDLEGLRAVGADLAAGLGLTR